MSSAKPHHAIVPSISSPATGSESELQESHTPKFAILGSIRHCHPKTKLVCHPQHARIAAFAAELGRALSERASEYNGVKGKKNAVQVKDIATKRNSDAKYSAADGGFKPFQNNIDFRFETRKCMQKRQPKETGTHNLNRKRGGVCKTTRK